MKEYTIINLRDNSVYNEKAAEWFNDKWKVPVSAYLDSMEECRRLKNKVPQWYLRLDGEKIIAGMGVIENDFHERKDLSPNVCAVYVDNDYRGQGLARKLLDYVCEDMARLGYDTLYLITTHTEFYERCGWEFYCNVKEDSGDTVRMYRHVMQKTMNFEILKSYLDESGRLVAFPAKRKKKLYALCMLAEKFERGRVYTEKEVNELLNRWHTFGDPATLRRELYNHRFLNRDSYGREYRLEDVLPTIAELEKRYE